MIGWPVGRGIGVPAAMGRVYQRGIWKTLHRAKHGPSTVGRSSRPTPITPTLGPWEPSKVEA
jgi:hypothetical protein